MDDTRCAEFLTEDKSIETMPRSLKERILPFIRTNLLTLLTILAVIGGVTFGIILRYSQEDRYTKRQVKYVAFPGEIFLQMLKGLILPLIVSSIVSAIGTLDLTMSGKIGFRAITYYLLTTVSAVILGIVLCITIRPGHGIEKYEGSKLPDTRAVTTEDTLLDLIRNMFPPNYIQACVSQFQTVLTPPADKENATIYEYNMGEEFKDGTNTLGMVVFAVVMGITLARLGEQTRNLLDFFESMMTAMMTITGWVIWISPLGVFFLVTGKIIESESLQAMVKNLSMYFITVITGLLIHGVIILPLYYSLITRKLPFRFLLNMSEALTAAFGTGSSNAILPITMKCVEEKNKIDPRVSKFVLPVGATINMDGTALYEAVAAIYIAQLNRMPLSFGQYVAVSVTATMASIGAAAIPQAGLVTLVMVLNTVGLPANEISLIMAVDWLLDRVRTTINVLGDALGTGIVDHLSQKELRQRGFSIVDANQQELQEIKNASSD